MANFMYTYIPGMFPVLLILSHYCVKRLIGTFLLTQNYVFPRAGQGLTSGARM
jgi:hypothetical protein